MAGSWGHVTDDADRFTGTALIENMGDAHEALEQLHGMVLYLAAVLGRTLPGKSAHEWIADAVASTYPDLRRHEGLAGRVASHADQAGDTLPLVLPRTEYATFRGQLTQAEAWLHGQAAEGWRLHTFAIYAPGGAPQGLVVMERTP